MITHLPERFLRAGDMAQWQSTCLACVRPWVGSLAPKQTKPKLSIKRTLEAKHSSTGLIAKH
jgi:hypothetical protein